MAFESLPAQFKDRRGRLIKFRAYEATDFEGLKDQAKARGQNLDELVKRLLLRTDKWMTSMYKQLRKGTVLVICGDHGRYMLDFEGTDRITMMRAASLPVAIFIKKEDDGSLTALK